MSSGYDGEWPRYVPVAERRRLAAKEIAKLKRAGRKISPVEIEGRKITQTFWGDAWSQNLESYSDYANRLPRGRTYVRNGSLLDLQIEPGCIRALVNGTEIYQVNIEIKRLAKSRWSDIRAKCAGQIGSLVELLAGSVSKGVMQIVTRKGAGLFPAPREISLGCSCPDRATMCKHVAATLYGVGSRLDLEPELLFTLRGVDPAEMAEAAIDRPVSASRSRRRRVLESGDLSSVFGIDFVDDVDVATSPKKSALGRSRKLEGKAAARKKGVKRRGAKSVGKKSAGKGSAKKQSGKNAGGKKARAKKASRTEAAVKRGATRSKKG